MRLFFATWALVTAVACAVTFPLEVQNAFFAAALAGLLAALAVTFARIPGRHRRVARAAGDSTPAGEREPR
jgi:hypothetical protein